jgi:hypothetical protein
MLNIFTSQKVRSRMQSGAMGPYLSEIATVLCRQGYARSTIRLHRCGPIWCLALKEGLSVNDISTAIVDRYLEGLGRQFSPSCLGGRLPHKALGVRQRHRLTMHSWVTSLLRSRTHARLVSLRFVGE